MLRHLLPAVLSTALAAPALAAQIDAKAEVAAVVDAAMNAPFLGDMVRYAAQYAPDCVFIDEFAPFVWSGPDAMRRYLVSGGRSYEATRHVPGKAVFGPPRYVYVSGDRAMVVEPAAGQGTVGGKAYAEDGAFTLSLSRIEGRWKITSQTWTKTRETFDPYAGPD